MSETYLQRCAARYAASKGSPEHRKRSRRANLLAASILFVGLPLALLLVCLCEWLHWPRRTYVPITIAIMMLVSHGVNGYIVHRIERLDSPDRSRAKR